MDKGRIYIENGIQKAINEFSGFHDRDIYEVIKLVDGKPLFWEDHFKRLLKSIELTHSMWRADEEKLKQQVKTLVSINAVEKSNIRIIIRENEEGAFDIITMLVPQILPSETQYMEGVNVSLLQKERIQPNAKQVQKILKLEVDQILSDVNIWEVLLLNSEGYITEGSRSNVFFIINNRVVTSPGNEVLLGITRKKVIEICHNENIPFQERMVHKHELLQVESAFLTGTSPGLIPISNIDDVVLNVGSPVVKTITEVYREWVKTDILNYDF